MNCVDCGSLFEPAGGRGRPRARCFSCSPSERKPAGHFKGLNVGKAIGRSVTREIRVCDVCSTAFITNHGAQKICSPECKRADAKQRNLEAQLSARDRSARPCKFCGVEFAPEYGDYRTTYCSKACSNSAHSARPERSGKAHVRRAKRFGCEIETVDKIKVFERDGWRCRICNIETPRSLMGSMSFSRGLPPDA